LLDMMMPRLSGPDAMREIHAIQPSVPVILMSGYSEQDATTRFAGQRLAAFIQKPYDIGTLRETLRGVLQRGETKD